MSSEYIGDELELFEHARNWKNYWFSKIEPYTGRVILDVGAGVGSTATLFADRELDYYLAAEPDQENLEIIKQKCTENKFNNSFEFRLGGLDSLSESDLFDSILYIDVLEHISNDGLELEIASNHLVAGGRIIILSPAHQWLYSSFDASVSHYRRYNKKSLLLTMPPKLEVEHLCYLDSVGIFASAANRLLLKKDLPTARQIKIWDNYMIPLSRYSDRLFRFLIGKSVLAVFRLPEEQSLYI